MGYFVRCNQSYTQPHSLPHALTSGGEEQGDAPKGSRGLTASVRAVREEAVLLQGHLQLEVHPLLGDHLQ